MKRNVTIDVIKGLLIYLMICNHSIDYFALDKDIYKYFRFVTGIFIFMAGFITTFVYTSRISNDTPRILAAQRLFIRGIKLVGLFIFVNVMVAVALKHNIQYPDNLFGQIGSNIKQMLVYGNYKVVDFSLLVPIGYLIIIMGLSHLTFHNKWTIFNGMVLMLAIYCCIRFFIMSDGFNFTHIVIGLIGAVFGNYYKKIEEGLSGRIFIVIAVYLLHLIIVWNIRMYFPVYLLSIICNFLLLHAISDFIKKNSMIKNGCSLTGKYTLFCYLFHIMVLQVIKVYHYHMLIGYELVIAAVMITFMITYISVYVLDMAIKKSFIIRKVYTFVFA